MNSDVFATVVWFCAGALPFFLIQLVLCFKAKNRFIRKMPVFALIAGGLFAADMFFNFSGIHSGWHELGAFAIAVYVFIFSLGDIAAWVTYFIVMKRNRHHSEKDYNKYK